MTAKIHPQHHDRQREQYQQHGVEVIKAGEKVPDNPAATIDKKDCRHSRTKLGLVEVTQSQVNHVKRPARPKQGTDEPAESAGW